MLNPDEAVEVLGQFPEVTFAFAYGSGAVTQDGYDYSKKLAADLPMLDLILVVDNPLEWHQENMRRNPHHYTPLLTLSSSSITYVQEHFQAHLWFNPYVPAAITKQPGRLMKYGVISAKQALEDLTSWTNLYLAGRLHKPVHVLKENPIFLEAMSKNRRSALQTACLLLPQKFSEVDLFLTIASLSYVGDPRMLIGENPKKVENLVLPIVPLYQNLYAKEIKGLLDTKKESGNAAPPSTPTVSTASIPRPTASSASSSQPLVYHHVPHIHSPSLSSSSHHLPPQGIFVQDISASTRWQRATTLPSTLKYLLAIRPDSLRGVPRASSIRTALASIVASAATSQTIKGLFTAGIRKSTVYAWNKVSKRFGFAALPLDTATSSP